MNGLGITIPAVRGRLMSILARDADPRLPGWRRDPRTGLWTQKSDSRNVFTTAGASMMAKSIQYGHADSGKTIRYLEVGTGYTYPDKTDTALVSTILRSAIDSWDNTDIASDPVIMIASKLFTTSEAIGALMECGLFQESSGAPMFCRGLFGYGTISGATNADPIVITCDSAHSLTDGFKVFIENVSGMTELNDNSYYVDVLSSTTFALYSDAALTTSVDGTGYGVYSEGSPDADTWKRVIPKTSAETLTVLYSLSFSAG